MGEALQLVIPGGPTHGHALFFGVLALLMQLFIPYRYLAPILKWLTLSLFAYVATAFVVGVPWETVLLHLVVPHVEWTGAYFTIVVAVFGHWPSEPDEPGLFTKPERAHQALANM